jgi:hypothetical protein
MFIGFNEPLPVYEVITPQTKKSFSVRTMTVADEERLKASSLLPNKLSEHLNKCIFDTIVDKPKDMTYEDFLKQLTILDRDALLYALYHITYDEERIYTVVCSNCGNQQNVKIEASKTFDINMYPEDDVLEKRVTVPLPILKGYAAVIKQPTLADELFAYNNILPRPDIKTDILINTMIIDKILEIGKTRKTATEDGSTENVFLSTREDIVDAYLKLPAKDKKAIHKAYYENFGQFCVNLRMKVVCPKCNNEDISAIDLLAQFFRMVLGD